MLGIYEVRKLQGATSSSQGVWVANNQLTIFLFLAVIFITLDYTAYGVGRGIRAVASRLRQSPDGSRKKEEKSNQGRVNSFGAEQGYPPWLTR